MNNIPGKLGRYQIVREVGRGAMGVVYKAHDPIIEREVAIKAIHLAFQVSADEKKVYLNRFYREAKAAGKLNHPNIVTIYDVNEDKETGVPFIVMEFLEGTTLQEILASGILLPIEDVNNIIMQMADGLHYAHKQGVVHRDIKSANILILEGMKVKITDFGIARLSTSDLTKSGQFIGTPNYMAPEQVDGKSPIDGRSDLFSLGVIFYLLLTGERPFSGDSFTSISYKIVHVDPIPPRTINPGVPDAYNKILMRLLAKDPADRYADGAELIKDLRVLQGMPVDLQEVEAIPIEEVTVYSESPEPVSSYSSSGSIPRDTMASNPTMTVFSQSPFLRNAPVIGVGLLVLSILIGAIYFIQHDAKNDAVAAPQVPPPIVIDPSKSMSEQNRLRNKWDLAINYYNNGFYDRAEDELESILEMDPAHVEARKFLELIEEKKKQPKTELVPPPSPQTAPASVSEKPEEPKSAAAPEKEQVDPAEAAPLFQNVDFEFEHALPSGTLYIYMQDKLVYEASLKSRKEKVLLFRVNKGKLDGTIKIPVGETKLGIRVVCREQGVSAYKESTAKIKPDQKKKLKIRYVKVSRQLEVKWT